MGWRSAARRRSRYPGAGLCARIEISARVGGHGRCSTATVGHRIRPAGGGRAIGSGAYGRTRPARLRSQHDSGSNRVFPAPRRPPLPLPPTCGDGYDRTDRMSGGRDRTEANHESTSAWPGPSTSRRDRRGLRPFLRSRRSGGRCPWDPGVPDSRRPESTGGTARLLRGTRRGRTSRRQHHGPLLRHLEFRRLRVVVLLRASGDGSEHPRPQLSDRRLRGPGRNRAG